MSSRDVVREGGRADQHHGNKLIEWVNCLKSKLIEWVNCLKNKLIELVLKKNKLTEWVHCLKK